MNKQQFEKLVIMAFHPGTGDMEASMAFSKARQMHINSHGSNPPEFGSDNEDTITVEIEIGKITIGHIPLTFYSEFVNNISTLCWKQGIRHRFLFEDTGNPFKTNITIDYEGTIEVVEKLERLVDMLCKYMNKVMNDERSDGIHNSIE